MIAAGQEILEHLIPASLGGRHGVRNFICRGCNSRAGDGWDAALFEQLRPFTLLLDLKRQRGEARGIVVTTEAGERLHVSPSGKLRHAAPIIEEADLAMARGLIASKLAPSPRRAAFWRT